MKRGQGAPALPAALVGAALVVAAEVAVSVLLYTGPGFVPALSVILAVLLASLAVGLGRSVVGPAPKGVDGIRRRWLFLLMAFTLAAVFSATWEVFQGFGARAVTQAAGLVFLAVLPLLTGGAVLATMALPSSAEDAPPRIGSWAFAGAAMGVIVAGNFFFPVLSPTAVLLFCLVALSGAALLHGMVLDRVIWVHEEGTREGRDGPVRVERWIRGRPRLVRAAVLERGRLRLLTGEDGRPVFPEELAVEEGLAGWTGQPERILLLGAGCGVFAARLAGRFPSSRVVLVDGNEALLETVKEDLPGGSGGFETRRIPATRLFEDEPSQATLDPGGSRPRTLTAERWDLVIADAASLGVASTTAPVRGWGARLREFVGEEGVVILLPIRGNRADEAMLELAERIGASFARASLYLLGHDGEGAAHVPAERRDEWWASRQGSGQVGVLVAGAGSGPSWPDRVCGFLRVPVVGEGVPEGLSSA